MPPWTLPFEHPFLALDAVVSIAFCRSDLIDRTIGGRGEHTTIKTPFEDLCRPCLHPHVEKSDILATWHVLAGLSVFDHCVW
jgi:hypothetical protein